MTSPLARLLAEAPAADRLPVATALVLYELAASDHDFAAVEQDTIVQVMGDQFGVGEARVLALIAAAEQACKAQRDLHALTLAIKREVPDVAHRHQVVVAMWRVILADGEVAHLEEMLANSISSLIGVDFPEVARIRREILEG